MGKNLKLLSVLVLIMTVLLMFSMTKCALAAGEDDLDGGASGPPPDATFEHLAVEPTTYTWTASVLEIAIMGEGCTNWRDVDQTGTGWEPPQYQNYNWYHQDITAPFEITCGPTCITSVTIEIRNFDIDEWYTTDPEVDDVYLNGVPIGILTGVDDDWTWSTFTPSPSLILAGDNLIEIDVDATHSYLMWSTTVDWIRITITCEGAGVIPEVPLGTIMASATMIIALLAFVAVPSWRRKRQYVNV
jgi:hypothetical protein